MHTIIPAKISAHGEYTIEKLNVLTGEKTKYNSTNLCLPSLNRVLAGCSGWSNIYMFDNGAKSECQLGSGTVEPNTTDTSLTHLLWTVAPSSMRGYASDDGTKFITILTYVVPASSSYVGDISEIGLQHHYTWSYDNYYALITHSLLKDAEDNPYTMHKTDLDQITITYTITLSFSTPSVMPAMAWANVGQNAIFVMSSRVNRGSDTTRIMLDTRRRRVIAGTRCVLVPHLSSSLYAYNGEMNGVGFNSTNIVTIPVTRAALSHDLNGHFINSITIPKTSSGSGVNEKTRDNPLVIMPFPNNNLFSTYTLRGYSIGAGDGTTQDFIAPIPMWLLNTEKIYVDSVLMTRGVDYTCDNLHNLNRNIEIMPLYNAAIIDGYLEAAEQPYIDALYISDSTEINRGTENVALSTRVYKTATPHTYDVFKLTNGHPFIIELDDTLDMTVDEIYLWTYYTNDSQAAQYDIVTLEASSDKITWDSVLTDVAGTNANHGTSQWPYNTALSNWIKYTLTNSVNKKYWRVSVQMAGATAYHNRFGLILSHAGQPIHFNTAPALDAIITMDCDIDRPYKDTNHVIDTSATIVL